MLLLGHTCDIKRNEAVGTNGRKQLTLIASSVRCLFLPMSVTAAVQNGFSVSKSYDAYFEDGEDVLVGDKLVRDGRNYIVKGVRPFQVPVAGHVHALCEQEAA